MRGNGSGRRLGRCAGALAVGAALVGAAPLPPGVGPASARHQPAVLTPGAVVQLFGQPQGLAIDDSTQPVPPHGPFPLYVTAGGADWGVVNWSAVDPLPGFAETREAGQPVLEAASRQARVTWVGGPGGRYTLAENGAVLPCEKDGRPFEADLFAQPFVGARTVNGVSVATGYNYHTQRYTLDRLAALHLSGTVNLTARPLASGPACGVSQGFGFFSVVLHDQAAHQILFYKVIFNGFCGTQPTDRQRFCDDTNSRAMQLFYARSTPFGVSENLLSYGMEPMRAGAAPAAVDVDVLPHLVRLVANGPGDLDHDPSHWFVSSVYNGMNIWGRIAVSVTFADTKVVVTVR